MLLLSKDSANMLIKITYFWNFHIITCCHNPQKYTEKSFLNKSYISNHMRNKSHHFLPINMSVPIPLTVPFPSCVLEEPAVCSSSYSMFSDNKLTNGTLCIQHLNIKKTIWLIKKLLLKFHWYKPSRNHQEKISLIKTFYVGN